MSESSTNIKQKTEPAFRTPWAPFQFWLWMTKYSGVMQKTAISIKYFFFFPIAWNHTSKTLEYLGGVGRDIADFPFTLFECYNFILWDQLIKLFPASVLVVPLGLNVLHLEVEERGLWQKKKVLLLCLPACLPKLKSKCHCVHVPGYVFTYVCKWVHVRLRTWAMVVGVDVGVWYGLTNSILSLGKLLALAYSQAERMRGTERGRGMYSPEVITLLKTTSSHHVYLSHLSKPQTALCSKSHFSRADDSVCRINFSLHLSQEQPL